MPECAHALLGLIPARAGKTERGQIEAGTAGLIPARAGKTTS